jgi:hypothetical protein
LNTVGRTIITIGSGRSHDCAQHSPASPFFKRLLIVAISRKFDLEKVVADAKIVATAFFVGCSPESVGKKYGFL